MPKSPMQIMVSSGSRTNKVIPTIVNRKTSEQIVIAEPRSETVAAATPLPRAYIASGVVQRCTSESGRLKNSRASRTETSACRLARKRMMRLESSAESTVLKTKMKTAASAKATESCEMVRLPMPTLSSRFCTHAGRLEPLESELAAAPIPDTATAATSPIRAIPIKSRTPSEIWIAAAKNSSRRLSGGNSPIPLRMAGTTPGL